ncbi:AFG1-like ATPase-domain-containing protein [Lipomyces oligophaga]|uniref:AFG1-like ATPase-domain-containing protein n=1 Tax=Lipomyces oligophaga TaxID=45792 RepID=UPI0034CD4FC7
MQPSRRNLVLNICRRRFAFHQRTSLLILSRRLGSTRAADPQLHKLNGSSQTIREEQQTGLAITDPYVFYRQCVALGRISPDDAQLRAALEFQKLYYRVKDYTPPVDFRARLEKLARLLEDSEQINHKIWYSPERETVALIRTLSDEEELYDINCPQGLLIHGEVGSGKSMLMDLFADSLPHGSKRRWHYHNFMLWVYARIHRESERNRKASRLGIGQLDRSGKLRVRLQEEFVLLQVAQDLMAESAILLLDEFMLPDIAAAKIVKTLFTYFFKMGGILVATSNRLPKELYSADFNKSQMSSFYNILQARCVTYDMRSGNDWRTILSERENKTVEERYWVHEQGENMKSNAEEEWTKYVEKVVGRKREGNAEEIIVYGRRVQVPWQNEGAAIFKFSELCDSPLGSADYISLTARYHTIVIDDVPVLKVNMKNQARRLITLIDALYESRVRLIMRAQVPVEGLFFPDATVELAGQDDKLEDEEDSLEQEMFSEVDMELESPSRPNVASYDETEKVRRFERAATPSAGGSESGMETSKRADEGYTKTSAFTGEDEKFAYKRAISRLREMTSSDEWWTEGQWSPVERSTREWETEDGLFDSGSAENSLWLGQSSGRNRTNERQKDAPRFSLMHFWSLVDWGRNAGRKKDERTRRWLRGVNYYRE